MIQHQYESSYLIGAHTDSSPRTVIWTCKTLTCETSKAVCTLTFTYERKGIKPENRIKKYRSIRCQTIVIVGRIQNMFYFLLIYLYSYHIYHGWNTPRQTQLELEQVPFLFHLKLWFDKIPNFYLCELGNLLLLLMSKPCR